MKLNKRPPHPEMLFMFWPVFNSMLMMTFSWFSGTQSSLSCVTVMISLLLAVETQHNNEAKSPHQLVLYKIHVKVERWYLPQREIS